MDSNNGVSYEQVRSSYLEMMTKQVQLTTTGTKCDSEMLWDVLGLASVGQSSIHGTCQTLEDAPTAPCILYQLREGWLAAQSMPELEQALNELLATQLPPGVRGKRHEVAIDMTEIPYHGEAQRHEDEVRRGKAKSGTTHFHVYAAAYVLRRGKRVTVAVAYWQAGEAVHELLKRLYNHLCTLEVGIKRLLLDRQFCNVATIAFLQQQPFQTIMPVPVRSNQLRQLRQEARRSHITSYTMKSPQAGEVTIRLYVVRTYLKGRYGQHGVEVHFFTVIGPPWRDSFYRLAQKFRSRFGIESSFRMMNRVRARTSSRDPKLRFLFVVLALLLINLWRTLSWLLLATPRRGGRLLHPSVFRFRLFSDFLADAIRKAHRPVGKVFQPMPDPCFLNY
jgi:putative transposase